MQRMLYIVGFITFAAALSSRAVDPVIPQIAGGLGVDPATAAMLSTAFASYGLIQPVLGPVADAVGKMRVMTGCIIVLAVTSFLCAVVTSFPALVVLRIVAGAACGGSFPVALAIIADNVPVAQRQVAIGRMLAAAITGNLLGAAASGIVADVIHWRGVFVVLGCFALAALVAALVGLRGVPQGERQRFHLRSIFQRFRGIFANPLARVCYSAVLLEGIFLFGIFPFVALLLHAAGESRALIAGLVIAAFALGGVVYSFTVGMLLKSLGQARMMMTGGAVVAFGLAGVAFAPPWPVECLAFAAMGCGFYMLHGSIQVYVTELAPNARSSAVAFHSLSFFTGQGIGPIAYGFGLGHFGAPPTLIVAGVVFFLVSVACARLLAGAAKTS